MTVAVLTDLQYNPVHSNTVHSLALLFHFRQCNSFSEKTNQAQLASHFLKYQAARVKPLHTAEFLAINENLYGASGAEPNKPPLPRLKVSPQVRVFF